MHHTNFLYISSSLLFGFMVWIFAFAPDKLPPFKQKIVAILCAGLASAFAFFISGEFNLKIESFQLNLYFTSFNVSGEAVNGFGIFVFVMLWWLSGSAPIAKEEKNKKKANKDHFGSINVKAKNGSQVTTGNGSHNITGTIHSPPNNDKEKTNKDRPGSINIDADNSQVSTGDGSPNIQINIENNIPEEVYKRLLKTLKEKDVDIAERDKIIQKSIAKYNELKSEDNLDAQAKEKLLAGDYEGAEKLLRKSFEKNLESVKSAAIAAYRLGSVKELQIEYAKAREYYEKAVQLEPENSKYLNALGLILYDIGEYNKAIEFYNKDLKISIAKLGKDHPDVAGTYNNLGLAYDSKGNYEKAIEYFDKALKIWIPKLGRDHPHTRTVQENLSIVKKKTEHVN